MEQRKEVVLRFVSSGLSVIQATIIAGIKKSTYYYRPSSRRKGKLASKHTLRFDGTKVDNDKVVSNIFEILEPEFHNYGYQTVTQKLRHMGYIINPKKVYRLMKENQLLHPKIKPDGRNDKTYVKHSVPLLEAPFATVEVDIKYIYIAGLNKNAYLITFVCTFCRFAPVWDLDLSMRSDRIVELLRELNHHPVVRRYTRDKQPNIVIRTDNGPQFIAKKLKHVLETLELNHEYIKPATPQDNGHIEGFHSIVTSLVTKRFIFEDLQHARQTFERFFFAYNNTRIKKDLLYYAPKEFLELWEKGYVEIKKNKKNKEQFYFKEKPNAEALWGLSSILMNSSNEVKHSKSLILNHQEISPVL